MFRYDRIMPDKIFLEGLIVSCKIGIFAWERKIKQKIMIDLEISSNVRNAAKSDRIKDAVDYKKIAKHIIRFVSESEFFLIETSTERLAASILDLFAISQIRLRISKPGAIRGAKNVGIEIVRRQTHSRKKHAG